MWHCLLSRPEFSFFFLSDFDIWLTEEIDKGFCTVPNLLTCDAVCFCSFSHKGGNYCIRLFYFILISANIPTPILSVIVFSYSISCCETLSERVSWKTAQANKILYIAVNEANRFQLHLMLSHDLSEKLQLSNFKTHLNWALHGCFNGSILNWHFTYILMNELKQK